MANHKSAIKEHRRSEARRQRNRFQRARLRTEIKKLRRALDAGNAEQASTLLPATLSLIDRTARHGAIPVATADRAKSRLTLALNRLADAAS